MESFLKVPIFGPHLPFYERNAITRAEFTIIWQGVPRSNGEPFFGLHLCLARRCSENLQSAKGPAQYESGQGNNTVSRRNHLLYHF